MSQAAWNTLTNEEEGAGGATFQYQELNQNDPETTEYARQPPKAMFVRTLQGRAIYSGYPYRTSKTLGEGQIGVGFMAAVLNGIGLALQLPRNTPNVSFYVATGMWSFILFCLSGSFAILSAKRKTSCPIVAHLVLAIFSSSAAFVLTGQGAGGIAFEVINAQDTGHLDSFDLSPEHHVAMASLVISVFLMLCGLLEFVICIWGSCLSCRIVCCGDWGVSLAARTMTSHPGQPMIVVNGQAQAILDSNSGQVTGLLTDASTTSPTQKY